MSLEADSVKHILIFNIKFNSQEQTSFLFQISCVPEISTQVGNHLGNPYVQLTSCLMLTSPYP